MTRIISLETCQEHCDSCRPQLRVMTSLVTALTQHTCLFTGELLGPQTEEEHTIPRAMGGRIRSRLVSCDRFNHRCGDTLDEVLASVYAVHMNHLAPLLSGEHQPGQLNASVPGEPPGLVLEQGALTRRNCAILGRDEKGRPNKAIAADRGRLEKLARQLGVENDWQFSSAPASQSDSFHHDCPVIRPALEVAALKACLLTFDHLLWRDPNRFTRSVALAQVRGFVEKAAIQGKIDPEMCYQFSLGMQYDRLPLYRRIRKAIPFVETPFEHVLLVAGNGPARCIDIVWVVLGFDPFGFRVAHEWHGGSFAFGVVNGILKDGGVSAAVPLVASDDLLCHPTNLRSCLENALPARRDTDFQEIISSRCTAGMETAYLVDMQASDALRHNLIQGALCDPPQQRNVGTQLLKRLRGWFMRTANEVELKRAVADVLRRNSRSTPEAILRERIEDESATDVNWPACLSVYRACLADLRSRFGPPASVFVRETRFRTD